MAFITQPRELVLTRDESDARYNATWKPNTTYKGGDTVSYRNKLYRFNGAATDTYTTGNTFETRGLTDVWEITEVSDLLPTDDSTVLGQSLGTVKPFHDVKTRELTIYDERDTPDTQQVLKVWGDYTGADPVTYMDMDTNSDFRLRSGGTDLLKFDESASELQMHNYPLSVTGLRANGNGTKDIGSGSEPFDGVYFQKLRWTGSGVSIITPMCMGAISVNGNGTLDWRTISNITVSRQSEGTYSINVTGSLQIALLGANYVWYTVTGTDASQHENMYVADPFASVATGCRVCSTDNGGTKQDGAFVVNVWMYDHSV